MYFGIILSYRNLEETSSITVFIKIKFGFFIRKEIIFHCPQLQRRNWCRAGFLTRPDPLLTPNSPFKDIHARTNV